MQWVVDTSAIVAVMLREPERDLIVAKTAGCDLVACETLPFEVGNALIAMLKKGRLSTTEVGVAWSIFCTIPVELKSISIEAALDVAIRHNIYAFDAYVVQTAIETRSSLITLDKRMSIVAKLEGVKNRGSDDP